jgi:tripartite-type tricarboxylate transporter receptor subunit TctC
MTAHGEWLRVGFQPTIRETAMPPKYGLSSVVAGVGAFAVVSLTILAVSSQDAWSQSTRSIKMVVPIGPGSGLDIVARVLAEQIGRTQGLTTVVENRPGAAQSIATEAVARAAPDGKTVLFIANPFVSNPHLRRLNYDPLTSFEPICKLANQPQLIVVNSASPYSTLADLLTAARAKPGALTLASFGPASATHIAFEMLKRVTNVNMMFVPYSSTPPTINALLGEHVTSVIIGYAEAADLLSAGKLRALATGSRTRIEALPDVPTVAESGYKDYEIDLWFGVVTPAKTPKETVSQLAGWFTAAMQAPEVKAKLVAQALYPVGMCGADFGVFIRKQYDEYGRIIGDANLKAE